MNIFLTGATGFIGLHLARAFHIAGHRVCCAVRELERARNLLPPCQLINIDFAELKTAAQWLPHLQKIDAVVNTVGIFQQTDRATFTSIHTEAPCALFEACALAGIKRVVQISALGTQLDADTEFLRSKARADAFLLQQNSQALVLQPSLVFGEDISSVAGESGSSSELFVRLAFSPLLILPDGGNQRIQPVHIDDIVTAVFHYLEYEPVLENQRIAAVGAIAVSVRDYLQILRQTLGHADAHVMSISSEKLAHISRWLPIPWISADALQMLQKGSHADVSNFSLLLDRPPLGPREFASTANKIRDHLTLRIEFQCLRYSIALLWILTGIISLGIYPIASSKLLLARVGIIPQWQEPLLYMAALLDILFGLAALFSQRLRLSLNHSRLLWLAQIATIVFYSAIIAWTLPEFWLHPYAPMLKNIPLLAAIALVMRWESMRRKNARIRSR